MNSEGRSVQNPLATLDLSRFRIDSESFVGQAIELGTRFEKLPPNIGDALLGFLRLQGLHYGKRYRSGIAIRRENLEHGVRQALISMDLGLEARAESDLNRAVEIIAQGDFEACRKRGYEIAFFRLQEMAQMCRAMLLRPEVKFLQSEYQCEYLAGQMRCQRPGCGPPMARKMNPSWSIQNAIMRLIRMRSGDLRFCGLFPKLR